MTQKIQKITSKGQVTLPVAWRRRVKTDTIVVTTSGDKLIMSPARLENKDEYTVFDAIRDNKGKGLSAKKLSSLLKKIDS